MTDEEFVNMIVLLFVMERPQKQLRLLQEDVDYGLATRSTFERWHLDFCRRLAGGC